MKNLLLIFSLVFSAASFAAHHEEAETTETEHTYALSLIHI